MAVRKVWTRVALVLLLVPFLCAASTPPTDTIALWKGAQVSYGDEVTMYAFRPEHPNGISIIVCPGGSYFWHDRDEEGLKVGDWLSSRGITAFVLFYRAAGCFELVAHSRILFRGKRHPDMISDAQRAMQYVAEHAPEYRLDTGKIGMMGFSAGGHLVLSAACFHETDFLRLSGPASTVDLRPAFVAAIYPVVTMQRPYAHRRSRRGLLGDSRVNSRKMRDSLSIEMHIPEDCPPVFLINCADDPVVPSQKAGMLDSALTRKGIPHRYIRYETGKHGFGVSDYYGSPDSREWRNEFLTWLGSLYSL